MSKINNIEDFKKESEKLIEGFETKAAKYDYSRININILENIKIDYFGSPSSIKYLINIKKGEKGQILLFPFEKGLLEEIYKAIINYKVNWVVILQKDFIRLHTPMVTTESKKKTEKIINEEVEQTKIQLRQNRRNLIKFLKKEETDEDDLRIKEKELEKVMSETEEKLNEYLKVFIDRLFEV